MRDAAEFDAFYRATSSRLLGYAYALTADWAQAQDLVQEAFLRAWRQWEKVSQYEDGEAWMRLVVSRLATDAWRRLSRWRKVWRLSQPCEQSVAGPSEQTVMLTRALATLPHSQRQAITMHYLMDLPVADIAAELNAPANTVKSWLARGRTALAAVLQEGPDGTDVPTVPKGLDRTIEPKLAVSPLGCELQ